MTTPKPKSTPRTFEEWLASRRPSASHYFTVADLRAAWNAAVDAHEAYLAEVNSGEPDAWSRVDTSAALGKALEADLTARVAAAKCPGSGRRWMGPLRPCCPVCHRLPAELGVPEPRFAAGRWSGCVPDHSREVIDPDAGLDVGEDTRAALTRLPNGYLIEGTLTRHLRKDI